MKCRSARNREQRCRAVPGVKVQHVGEIDKDALIATVVHDMRAPLNACLMSLSLVELKASEPAEVLRSVEVIRRNLERQAALINDLGDALQIVGGGLRLEREDVEVEDIVEAAASAALLPDGVGVDQQASSVRIAADPERLARALETLIESVAADAAAGDRVVVSVDRSDEMVRIGARVADRTGRGAATGRRKRPAMRLSVAGEIVSRHGGRMTLDEDSGAIELPLSS